MIRRQARPTGSSGQHPLSLAWSLLCVGRIRPHVKSSAVCATARLPGLSCQGLGGCTCRPGSRALTAARPFAAARLGGKGSRADRQQARGGSRAKGRPQPSPLRRAPRSNRLRPGRPLRPPALPSSASGRLSHLLGNARSGGRGSQERGAPSGAHHGCSREAAATTQTPLPSTQNRPWGCTASRPRPRCVTATVGARTPGAGPTSGGGSRAGMTGFECRDVLCNHWDVPSAQGAPKVSVVSRK